MKKALYYFILLLFTTAQIKSQNRQGSFMNHGDIFGTRVFIENRGQFDHDLKTGEKVFFLYNSGYEKIYFTDRGLVHVLTERIEYSEKEREEMEKEKPEKIKEPKVYYVNMNWQNSNPELSIERSNKQGHYFTYGGPEFNSYGYKKITYKNVYKGIDFEYTLPGQREKGIKYNVILHPGANAADIKMIYTGAVDKIKIDRKGNVLIKTPLDDIMEETPSSFYSNKEALKSEFTLEKNVLSLSFPTGYDNSRELIVDPWLTAITTLSNNNYGYDVDYDDNGNVYVYGGSTPCKIAKFSSTGTHLWTFAGSVATPSWSSGSYAGNFVVIHSSGKVYTGHGFMSSGAQIIRLNTSGNYDNLITPAQSTWQECWDMAHHCSTDNVYGMGGSTTSNKSSGIVDQSTGSLTPIAFYSVAAASAAYDVASHAIDDSGLLFWIYASGFPNVNNKMAQINASFTSTVWVAPSTFSVLQEAGNKGGFTGGALSSNGINCLAVNNSYLYYYDGRNLAAYNKANGNLVAATTIPTHTVAKRYAGIAVDDCNNLYLGGHNVILSYNFNGTTFSTLTPIPVGSQAANPHVCDIKLDRLNKILYVSGGGLVGTFSAANSTACNPLSIICYNPNPVDKIICAGSTITVSAVNFLNLTNPSYSLAPIGITSTNGSFVITPSANISYTAFVVGTTSTSAAVTLTSATNVTVVQQPLVATTLTQTSCTSTINAFNLNLSFLPSTTATPGYTITWQPSIPNNVLTSAQSSATGGIGAGTYTANVVAASGCTAQSVFTINPIPEPGNFVISPANNYVVNCYNPVLNINFLPATHNYTTQNGLFAPQNGPSAAFTSTAATGIYTITAVHPVSGCKTTQTIAPIHNTVSPASSIGPTFQAISCSNTAVNDVTAQITPTVNVEHLWLSPIGGTVGPTAGHINTYLALAPGVYTHIAINTSNGCGTPKTFTIFANTGFPTYSISSPQNFTLGCTTKSTAIINIVGAATTPIPGGPVSYTVLSPGSPSTLPSGPLNAVPVFTVTTPGTWTVITKDNTTACETRVPVSVLQNTFGPKLDTVNVPYKTLTCNNPSVVIEGLSSTPNISYNWAYPGVPGNVATNTVTVNTLSNNATSTVVANYTLTITDNSSTCKTTTMVTILQNIFPPIAKFSQSIPGITCATPTVLLTNNSTTSSPFPSPLAAIGYIWRGPTPMTEQQVSTTYIGSVPGTYTMYAKDLNNGCISFTTGVVTDLRNYPPVNEPGPPPPFVLDCQETVTIQPVLDTGPYTYTWVPPAQDVQTSDKNKRILTVATAGNYMVIVQNTVNGCGSSGIVEVINGSLTADFVPNPQSGFAPLRVEFTNNSTSTKSNNGITTAWNFGNSGSAITNAASITPVTTYSASGIYTIMTFVKKGECYATATKTILVELPSRVEIPNIFSPNADGANDEFFIRATGLSKIEMEIFDRWGHLVYKADTENGNVSWDGKNQQGKAVAEGVYSYVFKATGTDGKQFEQKGNISLVK